MSGPEGWAKLWEINPTEVFVDVEGNQVTPPVLVQVCVSFHVFGEQHDRSLCLLEIPNIHGLSDDMRRLLGDQSITKVFCDGTSGADRRSLGIDDSDNYVDLEDIASSLVGATGVRRGLARIMNLRVAEPRVACCEGYKGQGICALLCRHRAGEEAAAQGARRYSRPR